MMLLLYPTKKALRESIGQPLQYEETSHFGPEFKDNGTFAGAGRPSLTPVVEREFFAEVTMRDGLIAKVE